MFFLFETHVNKNLEIFTFFVFIYVLWSNPSFMDAVLTLFPGYNVSRSEHLLKHIMEFV